MVLRVGRALRYHQIIHCLNDDLRRVLRAFCRVQLLFEARRLLVYRQVRIRQDEPARLVRVIPYSVSTRRITS